MYEIAKGVRLQVTRRVHAPEQSSVVFHVCLHDENTRTTQEEYVQLYDGLCRALQLVSDPDATLGAYDVSKPTGYTDAQAAVGNLTCDRPQIYLSGPLISQPVRDGEGQMVLETVPREPSDIEAEEFLRSIEVIPAVWSGE